MKYQQLTFFTASITLVVAMKAGAASAEVFDFSYSSPSDTASGFLTTEPYNPLIKGYSIAGITGTRDGAKIDSLLPPNSLVESFANSDNLLLADNPKLDINGFSYKAGGEFFNIYFGGSHYHELSLSSDQLVTFSVTLVPEPSYGLSVLLSVGVLRGPLLRRKLKQKAKT